MMNDAVFNSLPLSIQRKIDQICDDFESVWQAGQQPRIEDYLLEQMREYRRPLLHELLLVELQLRMKRGEEPAPTIYAERFAEDADTVRSVFSQVRSQLSQETPVTTASQTFTWQESRKRQPLESGASPAEWPAKIGKYPILGRLGEGAFGIVFLAEHPQLQRKVAIKIPRPEHFQSSEGAIDRFLDEARHIALVKHPGIISVYDVDQDGETPYIVQEYIEGMTLKQAMGEKDHAPAETARLVMEVAEAIAHAHQQGILHRDLKPSNVLLDRNGQSYVADFGIALHENLRKHRKGERCGTPKYMPPEMVRGESHRMDGRCDIWSLGVILYEMLVGQVPFGSEDLRELFDEILYSDPMPPRQLRPSLPVELERICLKCLAKRVTDRYPTAGDLAHELRQWLTRDSGKGESTPNAVEAPSLIVPRGLRSFDEEDADFFLELLPGPKNREGLPEAIRFWKAQIEKTDADRTFPCGIIYGPSGSGKSSLVKAGLLPRLNSRVVPIYIESTPEDTELRLLKELDKRIPGLPAGWALPDIFAHLRTNDQLKGQKLLFIFDQFEQWLHATPSYEDAQLVEALRQCDGARVQAVVLVRDDFWMAATRLFRALEIELVEGHNAAAFDRFDLRHSKKVLTLLGQAYGTLPAAPDQLTSEQEEFLEQSVQALAENGKVVCVRLALFAQMVRGKPWTPPTLEAAGGAEGIGVAFLEDAFGESASNPKYRSHAPAAQRVLKKLLPSAGIDLKGHMQSSAELFAASRYPSQNQEFHELIRLLESELRLITPTDPLTSFPDALPAAESGAESGAESSRKDTRYQLTHDFLVPALRIWITRRQRATRRGRAELRLADRSRLWRVRQERKQLPSGWEWLNLRLLARPQNEDERAMMRTAAIVHLRNATVILLLIGLMAVLTVEGVGRIKGRALVERLISAKTEEVPRIVAQMVPYRRWVNPLLNQTLDQRGDVNDETRHSLGRLHVLLALLPANSTGIAELQSQLLVATPERFRVICPALMPYRESLFATFQQVLKDSDTPASQRFRAGCALSRMQGDAFAWNRHRDDMAAWLISQPDNQRPAWVDLLGNARRNLVDPTRRIFLNSNRPSLRNDAALTFAALVEHDVANLVWLAARMDPTQLDAVASKLTSYRNQSRERFDAELAQDAPPNAPQEEKDEVARRQANCAAVLFMLEMPDRVWPLLENSKDPRLRTFLIHGLAEAKADPIVMINRLAVEPDASVRQALLLCLGEYDPQLLSTQMHSQLLRQLQQIFHADRDPGVHSAADWAIRQLSDSDLPIHAEPQPLDSLDLSRPNWFTNQAGQTLIVIPGPTEFEMGSPASEEGRSKDERLHPRRIPRTYAISATETTVSQYLAFAPDHRYDRRVSPHVECPVNSIMAVDAMLYCRWLSEQEGIPEDQMCYPDPNEVDVKHFAPYEGYLNRSGYRLPTEAEWEYACRAGTSTPRHYGYSNSMLSRYDRYLHNSNDHSWPVAGLKPNALGLFDVYGNIVEACQDSYAAYPTTSDGRPVDDEPKYSRRAQQVFRGGWCDSRAEHARSARRIGVLSSRVFFGGFRVARTLKP